MTRARIPFYRVDDAYGCFSNFSPHPIQLNGRTWPTSEHFFQARKFAGTAHGEEVRRASGPMIAARMGRSRKRPLRPDWERVKDDVMLEALRAKFGQHPELRQILLETGDAELVEHTAKDRYWADGGNGTGLNKLGLSLMTVRNELERGPEAWEIPVASRTCCEYKIDSLQAGKKVLRRPSRLPGVRPDQTGTEKAPYLLGRQVLRPFSNVT